MWPPMNPPMNPPPMNPPPMNPMPPMQPIQYGGAAPPAYAPIMPPQFQAPMHQPQAPVMQHVVTTQITTTPNYGHAQATQTCQHCQAVITTRVNHEIGKGTWIAVVLMVPCFWPFAWLPCFIDSCKDAVHECPNCNQVLGKKHCLF